MNFPCRFPLVRSLRFACALAVVCAAFAVARWPSVWFGAQARLALVGTKTVCPSGCDYASLTAAVADIQAQGLSGALILELQPTYVSTVETFPLTIPALTGASATNTLTIRPATGATALSISSADTTAATLDLNGAQYITFDGRPGGTGTAKQLTIENTSTSGVAVRFINEASNNTLRHVTLRGVNTSASSGTAVFSTTTGANGNDNNTLDTCDIRDGASTPANALYASGSTGTTAQNNSGNTVTNCNIFNFYASTAVRSAGVRLDAGNTNWTITGSSFYQTVSRAPVAEFVIPIYLNSATGDSFTVTSNFIGGTTPNAGGTAWTTTGTTAANTFLGIWLGVSTATPSSVQGNTITNFVWRTSHNATSGIWNGIDVSADSVNVGTVTGNVIGSGTGTSSVSVKTSGAGGTVIGINSNSSGTVNIAKNTIGSITTNGSASNIPASFTGIRVTAGTNTISNNTIGSISTANSLNAATSSTSTGVGQQVTGIISTSPGGAGITGNTVANLNNNYASTNSQGQVRGIITSAGVNTITGNTVRNLSTTSGNTNTGMAAGLGQSVVGIAAISTTPGQTVSQNTVHSLANTVPSASVTVTGIYYNGPSTGTNVIVRNFVHSLAVPSTFSTATVNGMRFVTGTFTAQNNMVRVGLNASGTSTASRSFLYGILDNGTTEGRNFYHNTVYLGGTQTFGSNATFAFNGSTGVSNTRTYQNNIFVNARTNSGATSKHYAVTYGGTTANPTGLTASHNLLFVSGTGGVLGTFNSVDRSTLAAWQTATGQDATSAVGDPLFVNPTGDASLVDLHLQPSNPAEGQGLAIAAVTDDFDGQARSTISPVDVGADAGSFTLSSDVFAPVVRYPLLTSGSTANRVLTGWASITDIVGVSGGANAPRLYFKKSTDADVFGVANDATGNGWKFVTGTDAGSGSYSFTMDYSIISGGSVIIGETVQYFVVAQDDANNLGSNPIAAAASANPPVQNISAKPGAGVNSFSILGSISGTKTVGTGGDYPSLSGAGGLFAAINANVVTGNLTVNIISDLTEDGSVSLNEFASAGYPFDNYTLTIAPDSATMRTISGTAAASLITLNGADRVTIDGSFGDSGRYLTFRNTSTSIVSSTIRLQNDSSNNAVRNCVVEGATTSGTLGVISFSTGTVTGNDNNLITGCQVRDLSPAAAGVPSILIGSQGSSSTVSNSGNTVSNNELFNFNLVGIYVAGSGNDSWTLSDNNIYQVKDSTSSLRGIEISSVGTSIITGNYLHNLVTTGGQSLGIIVFPGSGANTTISGNRITAFNVHANTTDLRGITAQGSAGSTVNIVNNQITLIPAASGSSSLYGLFDNGTAGTVVNTYYNSIVLGGTETGTRNSWASFRGQTDTHTSRNNLFLNLRTGSTANHFAAGRIGNGGSYTASHNVYAGTGTTSANFMDFSTGTTTPVSFATWQSSTGDTSPSASNPGGNYSTAMFVNAANGDLHLVPGGNVLVNNAGTPIAGVTDDYDGDARSATTPIIGSDEIVLNTAPTITTAAYSPLVRQQGTASSAATIATVNDTESGAGGVTVTAVAPAGITLSVITNTDGTITTTVAADCTATLGDT